MDHAPFALGTGQKSEHKVGDRYKKFWIKRKEKKKPQQNKIDIDR